MFQKKINVYNIKKQNIVDEFSSLEYYTYFTHLKYQLKYDYYNFLILFLSQNVFLTGSLFVVFMLCSIFLLYFHFTLLLLLPLAISIYFFGELISKNNPKRFYYFNISALVFLLLFQILIFKKLAFSGLHFTLHAFLAFLISFSIMDFSFLVFIERFSIGLKNFIMWGVKSVKKTKKSA